MTKQKLYQQELSALFSGVGGFIYELNLDAVGYDDKPQKEDFPLLKSRLGSRPALTQVTPLILKEAVENGCTFMPSRSKGMSSSDWISQQIIAVDLDNDNEFVNAKGVRIKKEPLPKEAQITPEKALQIMERYGIKPMLIYHTFHSTEDWQRFRIICALDQKFEGVENQLIKQGTLNFAHLFDPASDTKCTDLARVFLGSRPECVIFFDPEAQNNLQAFLNLPQIEAAAAERKAGRPKLADAKECPSIEDHPQDWFDWQVAHFDLMQYFTEVEGREVTRQGHINPCPICGHNDDLKIYGEFHEYFTCFGGSRPADAPRSGSIIKYLMYSEGLSVPDAQQRFRELLGVSVNEWNSYIYSDIDEDSRPDRDLTRFHKFTEKGKAFDIVDAEIAEDIKKHYSLFFLHGRPYIYRDGVYRSSGVYGRGKELLDIISSYILPSVKTAQRINRVYDLLAMDYSLDKQIDDLYNYPSSWINLLNGFLDVRTMELHPHDSKYLSVNQIGYSYDPAHEVPADCVSARFLGSMIDEPDDLEMLLQYAGLCMTTDVSLQKVLCFRGNGGLGKSEAVNMVTRLIGAENTCGVPIHSLGERFAPVTLMCKLLNAFSDLPSQIIDNDSGFKMLTGADMIQGEYKGGEAFTFYPRVRNIFSANRIPLSKNDHTTAYSRRFLILNITHRADHIENLTEELKKDSENFFYMALAAIHRCAVAAGRDTLAVGFTESLSSIEAVEEMYLDSDPVACWLKERTVKGEDYTIKMSDAYKDYESWSASSTEGDREWTKTVTLQTFRANLTEKGIIIRTPKNVRTICGLGLLFPKP